jgi:DNA-binding NarL/FixJ family response regulator
MSDLALGGAAVREQIVEVAVVVENPGMRAQIVTALQQTEAVFVSGAAHPDWIAGERPAAVAAAVVVTADISHAAGIDSLTRVRGSLPNARLVAVVPSVDWATAQAALRAGVDGIVLESDVGSSLSVAVLAVTAAQVSLPREAAPARRQALSNREKQLLGMVVMGFSNREIADRLHLTESTVKSHLASGFRKLGVRSRSEASALILDPANGLGTGILTITRGERDLTARNPG